MIRYGIALVWTFLYSVFGHFVWIVHLFVPGGLSQWFFRVYGRGLFALCGIRLEVEGLEHIDRSRRYLITANHNSLFDIPALMATLPLDVKYFAKRELARVPVFGPMLVLCRHVLVNRESRRGAVQALDAAKKTLARWSLGIFPEGTRSTDGKVHQFKTGGLTLAAEAGVPVLPVAIEGTGRLLPKGALAVRRGTIRIKVFPPVPPEEARDRKQLAERLETTIRSFIETDTHGGSNV